MPKFCANLTMLFNEHEFLERFAAAAAAGFKGVEYLFPYAYPKEQLAEKLTRHGLIQVLHNLPAGDWGAGERGIACIPGRARGQGPGDLRREPQVRRRQARASANPVAHRAVQHARHPRLLPQPFAAGARGHPRGRLVQPVPAVRHLSHAGDGRRSRADDRAQPRLHQASAACRQPGRNEPGTGEINYRFLFGVIERLGYDGWVGCEYKPKARTVEGLGWIKSHLGQF
jgi:hydroxypyruvate isomerase